MRDTGNRGSPLPLSNQLNAGFIASGGLIFLSGAKKLFSLAPGQSVQVVIASDHYSTTTLRKDFHDSDIEPQEYSIQTITGRLSTI